MVRVQINREQLVLLAAVAAGHVRRTLAGQDWQTTPDGPREFRRATFRVAVLIKQDLVQLRGEAHADGSTPWALTPRGEQVLDEHRQLLAEDGCTIADIGHVGADAPQHDLTDTNPSEVPA